MLLKETTTKPSIFLELQICQVSNLRYQSLGWRPRHKLYQQHNDQCCQILMPVFQFRPMPPPSQIQSFDHLMYIYTMILNCAYCSKKHNFTKYILELQWLPWRVFYMNKTVYVKDALEWKRAKSYISNSLHFSTGTIKIPKKKISAFTNCFLKRSVGQGQFLRMWKCKIMSC